MRIIPTRNRNNEFILEFILCENKMAAFECQQSEIGLQLVHWSSDKRNNFREGSSEPTRRLSNSSAEGDSPQVLNSNYLL